MEETYKILVKTAFGLEQVLAKELEELGASNIEVVKRAVFCTGDDRLLYRINHESRTALRVLKFIDEFDVFNEEELYKGISKINWDDIFDVKQTFAIDSIVNSTRFNHSKFVALKSKDAIVDQFRNKHGQRPSIDTYDPDFRILIHIRENTCGVFLDSSGYSLHKRGYRFRNTEAPISECLAAGMLLLADWNGEGVFMDPMCGSGTFLVEAAMIALNMPAGKFRSSYAFQKWKDYQPNLFQEIKSEANKKEIDKKEGLRIIGSDKSHMVVRTAKDNVKQAGLDHIIELSAKPIERLKNEIDEGLLLTNPPYDKRLKDEDIDGLYATLGDLFKKEFTGWTGWVISSNFSAMKKIGLSTSKRLTLYNGPDECRFNKYEMYSGSKRTNK